MGQIGGVLETMAQTARESQADPSNHITVRARAVYDRFPAAATLRYIRGSSGFAGFAKEGFSRSGLEEFSTAMGAILGKRWSEWGSEQIASNFVVANSSIHSFSPSQIFLLWTLGDSLLAQNFLLSFHRQLPLRYPALSTSSRPGYRHAQFAVPSIE